MNAFDPRTTLLVSALRRDGTPRPRCADVDGAALEAARRREELRYPELSGRQGRTRLVVLAALSAPTGQSQGPP